MRISYSLWYFEILSKELRTSKDIICRALHKLQKPGSLNVFNVLSVPLKKTFDRSQNCIKLSLVCHMVTKLESLILFGTFVGSWIESWRFLFDHRTRNLHLGGGSLTDWLTSLNLQYF